MSEKEWENGDQTYLVRLWREQAALPQCRPVWRCSIEDTKTHNRRGFRSVEDLAIHLCALAGKPNEMRRMPAAAHEEESGTEKAR
jgi:predicted amidophosphoribosyltransferase